MSTETVRSWIARILIGICAFLSFGCNGRQPLQSNAQEGGSLFPQRIICGAPATTEIVYALGCGDRVVGVSDVSAYPPEARDKPGIGGWLNPNRECLLMLRPDIIITHGEHASLADFAKQYNIKFLTVDLRTLDDIYNGITSIADALGVSDKGAALKTSIQQELKDISMRASDAPPRSVAMLFGRSPGHMSGLATIGARTFLNELVTIAGGSNVFTDAKGAYPQVSKETLLVRNPSVIIEAYPDGIDATVREQLQEDWWKHLSGISAVQNKEVHYLEGNYILIPGPRVAQIAQSYAEILHPELFRE